MLTALEAAGAVPLLLPLIDFERVTDLSELNAALDLALAGEFDWLVFSSVTTVRALLENLTQRGHSLAELFATGVQIATIGPTSAAFLESFGATVSLAAHDQQSAKGLMELWRGSSARVLLPQADIASPALAEGLTAAGDTVTVVTAYRTVDYPAAADRRLTAPLLAGTASEDGDAEGVKPSTETQLLSVAEAKAQIAAGTLHAVVAASPSAAARIARALAPLEPCRFIAIGPSTAQEAELLGLEVAAVASEPSPAAVAAATACALKNFPVQQPKETP